MERINYFNNFENNYVYYPIENEDIEKGFLFYDRSRKYNLKLLHTNVKKFLSFEKTLNFKYFTKISLRNFIIDDTIINKKGTISVKLPFCFEINNIHKL
jgi:hypothetical protein